jgi:hypothetical protein
MIKLSAIALAATAAISLFTAAVEAAPTIRDHRGGYQPYKPPGTPPTSPTANCPGGIAVNGKCATTVKPPLCSRPRHGSGWRPPSYQG